MTSRGDSSMKGRVSTVFRGSTKRLRWYDEAVTGAEELEAHLRKRMTLADAEMPISEEAQATVSGHHRVREEEDGDEERMRQKQVKLEDLDVRTGEAAGDVEVERDRFLGCLLGRKRYARRVDYLVDKLIENAALRRRTGELVCSASRGAGENNNGLPAYVPRGSHPLQDHLLTLSPRSSLPRPPLPKPEGVLVPTRDQGLEQGLEQEEEQEGAMGNGGVTHKEWGMIHLHTAEKTDDDGIDDEVIDGIEGEDEEEAGARVKETQEGDDDEAEEVGVLVGGMEIENPYYQ
jgi:hypothetical protein